MTPNEQLELWVTGNSVHNDERTIDVVDDEDRVVETIKMEGGECCPDFSCCHPELLAPKEMREMFRDHPERRDAMLWGFLGALLANQEAEGKVCLAGRPEPDWDSKEL